MTLPLERAAWSTRLADAFRARYPRRDPTRRRLGREGEHPVVHPDGTAADISVLWPHLAAPGDLRVQREGELVVAMEGEGATFASEVGRGTVELIVGPCDDLHGIRDRYEAAMARLLAAADAEGLVVLGYGIQPGTPATLPLMTPKQRYGLLLEQLGDVWLQFAVTASDQTHVDVALDEVVPATNLANLLAPVTIALCANSPVAGGSRLDVCSGREAGMGRIHAERYRHGMPEGPSADLEGWIGRTFDLAYLMHREGGRNERFDGSFRDWLEAGPRDDGSAYAAWLWHEHYIWNSARPRAAHGTVEVRSPCQQPWSEHMAAAALAAGTIAAHRELATFLETRLDGRAWPVLRAWHGTAVSRGLAAPEPADGLLAGVLDRCAEALVARGRGEEVYLDPIRARLDARRNPAQVAADVFDRGGLPALVAHARVR